MTFPRFAISLAAFVLLSVGPAARADEARIHPDLRARMAAAAPGERLEAYVVLEDQMAPADFEEATRGLSPRERRPIVAALLKEHAARTQADLRAVLDAAAAGGRARVRDVLWMGNAILFEAEAPVLADLARVPGVDRIRPIVDLDPAQVRDVLAPGSYPFLDDFETCQLAPHWTVQATGGGYASVTSAQGPTGSCHVIVASTNTTLSTVTLTTVLDLTGQSNVGIRFKHKEFGDEDHSLDGVYVSANGTTFHKVLSLTGGSGTYQTRYIHLDAAVASLGLSYTSTFHVRFSWQDNGNIPSDGFAFDDIQIAPGVGVPPLNPATPNVGALQAPQLWQRGFRGNGILLATLDDGVEWTHNDLNDRIWNNPGEIPGNGQDDDGNGKADDLVGWDFVDDDSTPVDPSSSHGTNTAGLMVGDGGNGQTTGMAPGATLIACRVEEETEYWQAQQYCLATGVDVISSSYSYKWPFEPDYHMHRQVCAMELAAGIVHANSIGNQGGQTSSHPVPFNVSTPGNCPSPFRHPQGVKGGHTSVLACGAILLSGDAIDSDSGRGPSAWENMGIYDNSYGHSQNQAYWDYPYGGFGGSKPGLLKPDVVTYTNVTTTDDDNGYTTFGGTSAATPQLGGGLVLLRQVQPQAMPRHLDAAIQLTAADLGPAGKDNRFGAGKLQVYEAARRLVLLCRADDPTPAPGQTIALDVFGEPNTQAYGFAGLGIADGPSAFHLTAPFVFVAVFPLDASGHLGVQSAIPNDPGLVGDFTYLQFAAMPNPGGAWGGAPFWSVPEYLEVQ